MHCINSNSTIVLKLLLTNNPSRRNFNDFYIVHEALRG